MPSSISRKPRPGKSHALNTAVAKRAAMLLAFTDDDVLPSPRWLAAYTRVLRETGADYAAGRILPLWEVAPPRWLTPTQHGVLAIRDGGTRRLAWRCPRSGDANRREHGRSTACARSRRRLESRSRQAARTRSVPARITSSHCKLAAAGFAGVYEPEAACCTGCPRIGSASVFFPVVLQQRTDRGGHWNRITLNEELPAAACRAISGDAWRRTCWNSFAGVVTANTGRPRPEPWSSRGSRAT